MPLELTLMSLVLALGLDALAGYPDFVYRRIGHPVTWIGALILRLDALLNRPSFSDRARRLGGIAALLVIIAFAASIAHLAEAVLPHNLWGAFLLAFMASALLASRSLYGHVRDVAAAMTLEGLGGARRAAAKIVGRDPQALDESGVARAAIESLAENASDGVVAPVFWFALLGLPGLAAYKAINTADSMIGHRTSRHEAFGWASARLDDLVNLPASRLTALLFVCAAALTPGASPRAALRAMWRDASRHRSPNAGWPESAMAGALGLRLAGPRQYDGVIVDDATIGDGRREATADDIHRGLTVARRAWALMFLLIVSLAAGYASLTRPTFWP